MIELKQPKNGARVSLQTSVQRDFICNGRKYLTDELDLQAFRTQFEHIIDPSRPAKITFEWQATDGLCSTIEISKKQDFSEILMSEVCNNKFYGYNFEAGVTYYWRVRNPREESEVFSFTAADEVPRFLYVDGMTNLRDLGGYVTEDGKRIKQGLIIRGAEPDMHTIITEYGKKTMNGLFGIKTEIDLRGEAAGFTLKSPIGDNVNYHLIPLQAYEYYVLESNFEAIRKIFKILSDKNNYPVFFHCWGGADRTGCLAFSIEALLGLCEEKLMQDFELTCLSYYGNIKSRDEKEFSSMIGSLSTFGESWKERMEKFLISCGVTKEEIENIREIMLEK